jgi:hypothetical protein
LKQILVTLALLFSIACASGGHPPIQPPQPSPEQAFAVVVKDFVTPEIPVNGALVQCHNSDKTSMLTGTTNEDGYISWMAQSFQTYACSVERQGYEQNFASHYVTPSDATLYVPLTPTPPPSPEHPSPIVGRLRIEGNCFRDDTGCLNPIYAHSGDMFSRYVRDPDYVRGQLDKVAAAGYHGLRVWAVLGGPYWAEREVGPGVTPDYWGKLEAFFSDLKTRNLRAVWSMGDIGQLQGTRRSYMEQLAALDAKHQVVDFLDCGNEAWQTGEPSPAKLAECVSYYQNAGGQALLTLTSPPGEEKPELDAFSIPPADLYDVHGYRGGHFWDKIRHIFSIPYEIRPNKREGIQSEPFGNGGLVSVTENKDELNHEAMALGAAMSAMGRQVWVWFSGEGVILQRGLETQQGFDQSPKVVALLPKDLSTFPVLHHSGSTWASIRVLVPPRDDVRIDGAQSPDGRTVQIIYGPPGGYNFRVAHNFTGKMCNPADASCVEVRFVAGDTVNIAFDRGRILIGELR